MAPIINNNFLGVDWKRGRVKQKLHKNIPFIKPSIQVVIGYWFISLDMIF